MAVESIIIYLSWLFNAITFGFGYTVLILFLFQRNKWANKLKISFRANALFLLAAATLLNSVIHSLALFEFILGYFDAFEYESFVLNSRFFGPYKFYYFGIIVLNITNVIASQLFWLKKYQSKNWLILLVLITAFAVPTFERFIIIVTSLHRDFLVSSWSMILTSHFLWETIKSIVLYCALVVVVQYLRKTYNKKNDLSIQP